VAPITVCVYIGVPPRECRSLNYSNERTLNFLLLVDVVGWKETQGIQNIGIEDSQGNRIVDQKQVLKIWENYVTELYDRPNRQENLEVEPEEAVDTDEKGTYILQSEVEKLLRK